MWLIIAALCVNQVFIIGEAYYDAELQKEGKSPKHGQSAFFRGLGWALAGGAINYGVWGMAILFALLLGFQFYLQFDYIHNRFTGKVWWYGNNGFFDSLISGAENRYKELALRFSFVLVTGFIYFNLYEHIYNQ